MEKPTARSIISDALCNRRDDFNAALRAQLATHQTFLASLSPDSPSQAATARSVRASIWACDKVQTWSDLGDLDALVSECGAMIVALNIACKVLGIPAHVRTAAALRWQDEQKSRAA